MNELMTIAMERKLYKLLRHGTLRHAATDETRNFGAYIEKRFSATAERRKRKAAAHAAKLTQEQ